MKLIFRVWVSYYFFVRILYKNKAHKWRKKKYNNYKGLNDSIVRLVYLTLYVNFFMFFGSIVQYIFYNFPGIEFIARNKIHPFVPGLVIILLLLLIRFLFFQLFPGAKLSKAKKISIIRKTVQRMKNIRMVYPITYIVFTCIAFMSTLIIMTVITEKFE